MRCRLWLSIALGAPLLFVGCFGDKNKASEGAEPKAPVAEKASPETDCPVLEYIMEPSCPEGELLQDKVDSAGCVIGYNCVKPSK